MNSPRDTLLGMVTLFCLSLSLGLFTRLFLPEAPPLFTAYHGSVSEEVQIVDPTGAHRIFEEGGAVFVDARELERYEYEHIPGAINLPVDDFEEHKSELIYLRTAHQVVVYCEDIQCGASRKLLELLTKNQVRDLVLMPEGLEGWVDHGYPTLGGRDG
ncbi:MAG: rhodanese-like domain-containing protein [Vulcanimicrobiota bacterium]